MTYAISKWLNVYCLFSAEMTQLNDFDTDNENSKTPQISVSAQLLIILFSKALPLGWD